MEQISTNLTDSMEGFHVEKPNYSRFEASFRRWLVAEIDSGRMNFDEAKRRFKLPSHFSVLYRQSWQPRYSDELHVSLSSMTSQERSDNKKLEQRIKELEKQLEYAQMKNIAINTLIDVAETELKISIRKTSGSKQ